MPKDKKKLAGSAKRWFGAHVSSAGGFKNAAVNGRALGATAIQIHPSPPQRWNTKPYPEGYEDGFLEELPSSGIEKVFFHGVYLINLASPDPRLRTLSTDSLAHYLDLMNRIEGDGVIFHCGSLKDEPSEEAGYRRAADCIAAALEKSPGSSRLLLEVAAGSGSIVGDRLEELAEIYSMVKNKERVGFALDTQHLWASGYDIDRNLDEFMQEADKVLSFEKIWAVHVNDSLTELGSRKDRHASLGEGLIGERALKAFCNRSELEKIPMILETPALKELETAKTEVKKFADMLEQTIVHP